ncbi:MAG: hypothetical protein GC184_01775 [Rhizobiales bacterium]|nr:hypothetical protein [Hyphomicrobiales bacterium]
MTKVKSGSENHISGQRLLSRGLLLSALALSLAGCSMPAANSALGRLAAMAGLSERVMYSKNSHLAARDCQTLSDLLHDTSPVCTTAAKPRNAVPAQQLASREMDPLALGFAPVDRRAAADFSLEIARQESRKKPDPLVFGMLSATFGQSWSYELTLKDGDKNASGKKVAAAETPATGL